MKWNLVWVFLLWLRLATRWVAFLQKAQNDKVTCKIPCHTEALAEVSTKSKRILNSLDFSLCGEVLKRNLVWVFVLWSVENGICVDFFAAATPCNPLGRYAQNDRVLVILIKLSY